MTKKPKHDASSKPCGHTDPEQALIRKSGFRISNFDKNLQEKGIRDLSLKTSISENRHGAQISEVLPHFGEEKAP